MLRIQHCLDTRVTDDGQVVSPTHQPHFIPRNIISFNVSGTHFCYRLSKPEGLVRPEGLDSEAVLVFFKLQNTSLKSSIFNFSICTRIIRHPDEL
jgi:hypothetical protein